jgi:hypothetical protein
MKNGTLQKDQLNKKGSKEGIKRQKRHNTYRKKNTKMVEENASLSVF